MSPGWSWASAPDRSRGCGSGSSPRARSASPSECRCAACAATMPSPTQAWLAGVRGGLLVATDARRKEVYAAEFASDLQSGSERVGDVVVARSADLPERLRSLPTIGRGPSLYPDSLHSHHSSLSWAALACLMSRPVRWAIWRPTDGPAWRGVGDRGARARRRVRRPRTALPATARHPAGPAQPQVDARLRATTGLRLRDAEWTDLALLAQLETDSVRRRRLVAADVVGRARRSPPPRLRRWPSTRPTKCLATPASTCREILPTS